MTGRKNNSQNPTGYVELVRGNPNFRNLWFGQIVSLFGDWFNLIASAALVAMLTQSGLAIGGLFIARMMAQFFSSPLGGLLADRYNRKTLLIITDVARGITVLGFLLVKNPGDVWLLYTLTVIQMAFAGIFVPTRNAILPDVVEEREIGSANALSSATWSTMLAFGAALGGIVAGEWGLKPAFIIDSLTFFLSTFFMIQIRYQKPELDVETLKGFSSIHKQYAEGLNYLKQRKSVLLLAFQKAAMAFGVSSAFQIVQVTLATDVFVIGEGGSTSLGIIYAAVGVGTGLGPIAARWITGDNERVLRRWILWGYLIAAVGLVMISTLSNFNMVLVGTFLRGIGVAVSWVFSTQLLLIIVPNRVRGRVFSTEFAIFTLVNAIGVGIGGWAFDNLGASIPQVLWGMTGITLILGILFWSLGILDQSQEPLQPQETG